MLYYYNDIIAVRARVRQADKLQVIFFRFGKIIGFFISFLPFFFTFFFFVLPYTAGRNFD